jgi:hypothetical protein
VLDLRPGLHEALREAVAHHGPVGHLWGVPKRLLRGLVEVVEDVLGVAPELLPHGLLLQPQVPPHLPRDVPAPEALQQQRRRLARGDVDAPAVLLEVAPHEGLEALRGGPPLLHGLEDFHAQQQRGLGHVPARRVVDGVLVVPVDRLHQLLLFFLDASSPSASVGDHQGAAGTATTTSTHRGGAPASFCTLSAVLEEQGLARRRPLLVPAAAPAADALGTRQNRLELAH